MRGGEIGELIVGVGSGSKRKASGCREGEVRRSSDDKVWDVRGGNGG